MTKDSISIAQGNLCDLDHVMDVMEDSFDPAFGEAWTAPQCAGLMPMPGVWLTLARKDEETVGFSLSRIVLREAELLLLAVRSDRQHLGIGSRLLETFVSSAIVRGAEVLHLEVREGNRAINLYERAGFTQVGRRKNYYSGKDGQLYDALTLAKTAKP